MNFYFNFTDGSSNRHIRADEFSNSIKTNMPLFKLSLFAGSKIEYKKITKYRLVVEKEQSGMFFYYKNFTGSYDATSATVSFSGTLGGAHDDNIRFKIFFEAYEGGLRVYDGSSSPVYVLLKNKCSEFGLDVSDASKVADMFEMKEENPSNISFTIIAEEKEANALAYSYKISPEGEVVFEKYSQLGNSRVEISEQVFPEMFKDGMTYIHFSLMDTFGNVNIKKTKVVLKNSDYYGFEFMDEPVILSAPDQEFSLSFRQRMVNTLRLGIVNENGEAEVSDKLVGLMDKQNGLVPIKLTDYFENIKPSLMRIAAYINDTDELSNFVDVYLDQTRPIVTFDNFDENNYLLHKEAEDKVKVVGTINDPNYFYIGESKKLDSDNMKSYVLVMDHRARYVTDGTTTSLLYSSGDYFYGIVGSNSFQILDSEKRQINPAACVSDTCREDRKPAFICLDKSLFDNYEKNIIENQGGLKIKGELAERILESSFTDFSNSYIIRFEVAADEHGTYGMDVGVEGFDYSFMKNINSSHVSFELDHMKRAVIDFEKTSIVIANTSKELYFDKFDAGISNKKLSRKKALVLNEINSLFISTTKTQCFATSQSVSFADDYLNAKETTAIYEMPIINYYGERIDTSSFKAEKISEKSYSFSLDLPVLDGFNEFDFSISDMAENLFEAKLIIEKNDRNIECKIDDSKSLEAICEVYEEEIRLVSNSDSASFIIEVENENLKQKNGENFIIVKNERLVKKSKIVSDNGKRNAYITLTELDGDEKFDICYNNDTEVIASFTVNKQAFFKVIAEKEVVAGANFYFLAVEKEEIAKLKIEHTNINNFNLQYNEKEGHIVIRRTKNDTFVERMDVKLTAYHESGKIKSGTANIKCTFYNESIVYSYEVDESQQLGDKIISPSYDLFIKTMYSSDIKEVYVYDKMEMNINNRRKYAVLDETTDTYKIKGLTTPIDLESVTATFVISEGIEVNKELFAENKICFYQLDDKLLYSYEKTDKNLVVYLENVVKDPKTYSVKIFSNGKIVFSQDEMCFKAKEIKEIELETSDLFGITSFSIEYVNEIGVKRYTGIEDINFSKVGIYARIIQKPQIFIEKISENMKFQLDTNSGAKNLKVSIRKSDGSEINSRINENLEIETAINEPGIYFLTINYEDSNTRSELSKYAFDAIKDLSNIFDVTNRAFERIEGVKTLIISNNSIVDSKKLGARIEHYTDEEYVTTYYPDIQGSRMEFSMLKNSGFNSYVYKDEYTEGEVAFFNKRNHGFQSMRFASEKENYVEEAIKESCAAEPEKNEEYKQTIFVRLKNKIYNGSKLGLGLSHKANHRYYIFSRNFALISGKKQWLELGKESANSRLEKIEIEFYKKNKYDDTYEDRLKEEIKKYIGGN